MPAIGIEQHLFLERESHAHGHSAINPMLVEGQVEGGVAMGVGFALEEEMLYYFHFLERESHAHGHSAINPMLVEGQVEGGVAMGVGFALEEEMLISVVAVS